MASHKDSRTYKAASNALRSHLNPAPAPGREGRSATPDTRESLNIDTRESPNPGPATPNGAAPKGIKKELSEAGSAIKSAASEVGDVLHEVSPITVGKRIGAGARAQLDRLKDVAGAAIKEGKRVYHGEESDVEHQTGGRGIRTEETANAYREGMRQIFDSEEGSTPEGSARLLKELSQKIYGTDYPPLSDDMRLRLRRDRLEGEEF